MADRVSCESVSVSVHLPRVVCRRCYVSVTTCFFVIDHHGEEVTTVPEAKEGRELV